MNQPTSHKLAACALSGALIGWGATVPVQALAQTQAVESSTTYPSVDVTQQGPNFRQFGGVEITGSSIIRKEQTQALPVQVITRQDIQRQGAATLAQVLMRLPNVVNGSQLGAIAKDFNGFTNGALHGMPTGTLVLLNGKRLAPFGIQTISGTEQASVDLSMLPLASVERIEVLTDGASSLYGTDAVAGVINIITRAQFNGIELSVNHSRPAGGAAQGHVASLVWGKGQLVQDGFSLRLAAEWDHTRALRGADRPDATQGRIGFMSNGVRYEADSPEVTPFTSPALIWQSGTKTMLTGLYSGGVCTGNSVSYRGYAGGCKVNALPAYDIYPESQGQKLHATGEILLPNGATLYSELYYAQQNAQMGVRTWPMISGRIVNQAGSPGYAEMLSAGLNPATGIYYWRADLPALQWRFDKTQTRAVIGLKGELQGWNYHTSLYQTLSRVQKDYDNPDLKGSLGLQSGQALNNANLLQPLDANNPLTAQLEALRGSWDPYGLGRTGLTALELRASRPWFEIQGRDVLVGWGLDARQETVSADTLSSASSQPTFSGKRSDVAAYAELQLPLQPDWDVIASWRTDRYSDVGSTTNGKLATRWAISSEWALRGSAGTGFRAPAVGQTLMMAQPYTNKTLTNFSCSNDLYAIAAALATQTGKDVRCRDNDVFNVFANGNPNLQPEKSLQATLGLAFTPHRNFTVAADY